MSTALITGASGGIGREFARELASKQYNLILVARNEEKLEELSEELTTKHKIKVITIAKDLSYPGTGLELFEEVQMMGERVDWLINNVGFGSHGRFDRQPVEKQIDMVNTNVLLLTELTHYFMQVMVERNVGKIINVSSAASFLPGPMQATYYATKAYVTSFTQALAKELENTEVNIISVCPGPVATEFANRAGLEKLKAFSKTENAADIAKLAIAEVSEPKSPILFTDSKIKFLANWILPFLSRKTVLNMSYKSMTEEQK